MIPIAIDRQAPVRFGIVGCGGMGRWHASNLQALPNVRLHAVFDTDQTAARRLARRFGVAAVDDLDALLRDPLIHVVSVCTPPAGHAKIARRAAVAGKHVLVEKPIALTVAEADRLIDLCAARGVWLGVVHQQRARSSAMALSSLLAEGEFGLPLAAAAIHSWHRAPSDFTKDAWRSSPESGGALLMDQAIHAIDLLVTFLGRPAWVSGSVSGRALSAIGEDTSVATIGFEGGALATLTASMAVGAMRDDITVELLATRGSFRLEVRDYDHAEITRLELSSSEKRRGRSLDRAEIEELVRRHGGSWRRGPRSRLWRTLDRIVSKERGEQPFGSVRALLRRRIDRAAQRETQEPQGHAAILFRMAAAARGDGEPLVTGDEARLALAVIEGLYESHRSDGRRIELALTP